MSGTTARSYRPGSWFAIAGERALILLPPTEKARVSALWELVDDGAGFDVTLDALISGGLRDLPTFVLVATDEGETNVVIRGQASATFVVDGEEVVVDGARSTTWAERTLTNVTSVTVDVEPDDDEGSTAFVVAGGVFRVSRIDQTPPGGTPVRTLRVVEDEPGEVIALTQASIAPPEPDPEPEPQPDPEPEPEPDPQPEPDPEPEPSPPTEPDLQLPPRPILPPLPPGYGVASEAPSTTGVARLVISSGETVDVDRVTVIGRAPEAKAYDYAEVPQLITVPSLHMEISSAHLEIRPGEGGVLAVATDLGSTNGTVVVQPGSGPADLAADSPVDLLPGALIDIGDGITIQITRGDR